MLKPVPLNMAANIDPFSLHNVASDVLKRCREVTAFISSYERAWTELVPAEAQLITEALSPRVTSQWREIEPRPRPVPISALGGQVMSG
jgi:hypothetical protein